MQKENTNLLIKQTRLQLRDFLININRFNDSNYSLIELFKWFVVKEKSIYVELNKLKYSDKILMGLVWCPTKYRGQMEDRIYKIRERGQVDGP